MMHNESGLAGRSYFAALENCSLGAVLLLTILESGTKSSPARSLTCSMHNEIGKKPHQFCIDGSEGLELAYVMNSVACI